MYNRDQQITSKHLHTCNVDVSSGKTLTYLRSGKNNVKNSSTSASVHLTIQCGNKTQTIA